jgi:hypothetical protein
MLKIRPGALQKEEKYMIGSTCSNIAGLVAALFLVSADLIFRIYLLHPWGFSRSA